MNLWQKLNPKRVGCTTCQGIDGMQGLPPARLRLVEPWKFGTLYNCSFCGRSWFQTDDKKRIDLIQERLLPLSHYWNQTSLSVDAAHLHKLAHIGGTHNPYYQYIGVPCSVRNASGQRHDKALVMFGRQPPYFWYRPEAVHWAGEIVEVAASPYTLPLEVRRATFEKQEIAMGFATVGIVDPQGCEYTLSCQSYFFDWKGVRGEEIRLSGRQKGWKRTVASVSVEEYYFVDWFSGCEKLLMPSRPGK